MEYLPPQRRDALKLPARPAAFAPPEEQLGDMPPATGAEPGPSPRERTAKALRRSWFEQGVRNWWLLALLMLLVTIILGWQQYSSARSAGQLVAKGELVTALIEDLDGVGKERPNYERNPSQDYTMTFSFTTADGQLHRVHTTTPRDLDATVHPTETLPLHVNPKDPENQWTFRKQAPSLLSEMLLPIIFLTITAIFAGIAVVRRAAVLGVWTSGSGQLAAVIGAQQSVIAPGSRQVRCVLVSSRDKKVITVQIPTRVAQLSEGDVFWLIISKNKSHRALAAMLYV